MLEKLFLLHENGTTVRTEVFAGITTFLTMAYIIFVNPQILANAGMDRGAVFVATCLAAAIALFELGRRHFRLLHVFNIVLLILTAAFAARTLLIITVIVGAGDVGQAIARKIRSHPHYNLRLVGFLDNAPQPLEHGRQLLARQQDALRGRRRSRHLLGCLRGFLRARKETPPEALLAVLGVVPSQIHGNASQPGAHAGLAAKAATGVVSAQKAFLGEVAGFLWVAIVSVLLARRADAQP